MPRMTHPELATEIEVAESAVPIHMASGWQVVPGAAEPEAEVAPPSMSLEEAMAGGKSRSAAKSAPRTEKE